MDFNEYYNIDRFHKFNQEINLSEYEQLEKIGKGQYSTVYKVKRKTNGCIYAMKIVEKNASSQKEMQLKHIRREIQNLLKCHSIKTYGIVFLIGFTETKEQFILIFEFCDTNLENYIEENYPNKKMPLNEIKLLFMELNEGFKILYGKNVIHRDIKINNILLKYRFGDKKDIIPLLADFGISRETSTENPMTSNISWALLSAPEILENGNDYSFASDLWSIGVLLYKLAFGKYPFEGNGIIKVYNNIMNNAKKLQKSGDKYFDDLISKLLNKNKEQRINYEQYFNHPFFKFNEPKTIINFNEKYNLNISSYNKRVSIMNYYNGNNLLKDLGNVEFINLKELHLQLCNISDLSPLKSEQFRNLLLLNLQSNKISNLNPLKNIKFLGIKQIFLGENQITNIQALKEIPFKQLTKISFFGNINLVKDDNFFSTINKILSK